MTDVLLTISLASLVDLKKLFDGKQSNLYLDISNKQSLNPKYSQHRAKEIPHSYTSLLPPSSNGGGIPPSKK